MADLITDATPLPFALPPDVDWHGSHVLLVELFRSIKAHCPIQYGTCSKNTTCTSCAMVTEQKSLDRLLWYHQTRTEYKEWQEAERSRVVVAPSAAEAVVSIAPTVATTSEVPPPMPASYYYGEQSDYGDDIG